MTRAESSRRIEPATSTKAWAGGRVAWFHCFSGIAGDMALGSLVDAGADPVELEHMLDRLPIDGWSLGFEPVLRNGIAATHAVVKVRDDAVVRTFPHVMGILEEARMPNVYVSTPSRLSHFSRPSRVACTVAHDHRCTSTRSAATTRSWTSSELPPLSSYSR